MEPAVGPVISSATAVNSSLSRLSLANSGGVLQFQVDFDHPAISAKVTAGSRRNFQAWFRDTAAGGAGSNLSNGLTIDFEP